MRGRTIGELSTDVDDCIAELIQAKEMIDEGYPEDGMGKIEFLTGVMRTLIREYDDDTGVED